MRIKFLGTGSASPHLERHPSACLVSLDNESILIDCGEGTQYRLLQEKSRVSRIRTICISHLHGDHYFGLVGLLSSLSLSQRSEPLLIIGPKPLKEIIEIQLRVAGSKLSYTLDFLDTEDTKEHVVLDNEHFQIISFPLSHRIPCTGFKVVEKKGALKLLRELLPEVFPIPFLVKLKNGEDVVDPISQKVYRSEDYTSPGLPEKSFAYCSDTCYTEKTMQHVKGVDLLYHEATFSNELEKRAKKTFHSTAKEAALIAKGAGVKKLLIAHFSSRYKDLDIFELEAREVFKPTFLVEQFKEYSI